MNQCRHCGVFVPTEKAFCPNCSEPIEPEEAPHRAATTSSDMMETMRDDPEKYKELLDTLKKQPRVAEAERPVAGNAPAQASVAGLRRPQVAQDITPPAKSSKRTLGFIIGAVSFLILLFVILLVFKLI